LQGEHQQSSYRRPPGPATTLRQRGHPSTRQRRGGGARKSNPVLPGGTDKFFPHFSWDLLLVGENSCIERTRKQVRDAGGCGGGLGRGDGSRARQARKAPRSVRVTGRLHSWGSSQAEAEVREDVWVVLRGGAGGGRREARIDSVRRQRGTRGRLSRGWVTGVSKSRAWGESEGVGAEVGETVEQGASIALSFRRRLRCA
jgi:hypothetical protein